RASTRPPELPVVRVRAKRPEQRAARPEPHRASVVVLAQDAGGYANLCRLITDAHMLGERADPSLAAEQVLAHSQGLVCLLGPQSSIGRLAVAGMYVAALAALRPFRDAFVDLYFVEVQHRLDGGYADEVRRYRCI